MDSGLNGSGRRRIRFFEIVQELEIVNLDDYTEEERENCWRTVDENDKTVFESRSVAARMKSGKPEKVNSPYRGLENRKKLKFVVLRLIDAVLDEQEAQWVADIDDHERIAAISQEISSLSKEKARVVALEDEQEAIAARVAACYGDFAWFGYHADSENAVAITKQ
jgi:hypothetical protein